MDFDTRTRCLINDLIVALCMADEGWSRAMVPNLPQGQEIQ